MHLKIHSLKNKVHEVKYLVKQHNPHLFRLSKCETKKTNFGQHNSKNIFFCHGYREHLSGQGQKAQKGYLNTFLGQWEAATQYGGSTEPNETHVCGDMNVDVYQGRWLQPNYPLITLSRMIKLFAM